MSAKPIKRAANNKGTRSLLEFSFKKKEVPKEDEMKEK
jgi:hypothetical protein